jgi:hypothetical protein
MDLIDHISKERKQGSIVHAVLRLEKLAVGEAGIPYGLEYPTTESLGLCHCKTSVLNKLCSPLE